MEEWKECKLGDIAHFTTGKLNSNAAEDNGIYPFFTCSPETFKINSYAFDTNAILLAGNNAEGNFNIKRYSGKFNAYQRTYVITVDENTDLIFLFYALKLCLTEFKHISQGTATKFLTAQILNNFVIRVPPLPTQQTIAAILSSLDDKIELNNKINTNLDQQAQALFKNWFVDFEPFGGKMPEGWKVGVISDFGDVICGKTPSTKIKDYYGDEIPFITIPDMHNSVYACYTERYLSVKGAQSQESKNLPPNSICVSCIATPGLVVLTDRISQTNQQINSIIPNSSISPYYVYLTMQNLSETITMLGSSGSTTSNLNKEQFSKIKIIITNDKTMKEFDSCVQPMFEKIRSLQKENNKLVTIRDTLLPKLMNGEIETNSNIMNKDKRNV